MRKVLMLLSLFVATISCATHEKEVAVDSQVNSVANNDSFSSKTSSFIKTYTISLFVANDSIELKEKCIL